MTEAKSTAKARLGVYIPGTGNSTTLMWFKEVKAIPAMGTTAATLDATHLESEAKEYIMDIPDQASSLDFTMNAMPTGASESNYDLIASLSADQDYDWVVEFPQLGYGWRFRANWNWGTGDVSVSGVMEITLSLVPRSAQRTYKLTRQCTLTYDGNGGTGQPPASQTLANGAVAIVAPAQGLTKDGHTFIGWNTSADGSGKDYDTGDRFPIYADTTLYAQWGAER